MTSYAGSSAIKGVREAVAGLSVVICGGGIAGIEGLLRLRRLAGAGVEITLVSPEREFVYRPLAVRDPFEAAEPRRYSLARIASDTGAALVADSLAGVDMQDRRVRTEGGRELCYEALLLAIGARESSPYEHALLFSGRDRGEGLREILREIEAGRVTRMAFVLADWPAWPVPLYELALMTAVHARRMSRDLRISFVTPEGRPLKAFGQAAGDAVARLVADAGIELHTGVVANVPAPHVVTFGETRLEADRIVTLPKISGPAVPGIPAGVGWFVPIDERCRVKEGGGNVFAAGDATEFPVKHGGIGAQQADTAAAGIAHLAGAGELPQPLRPVIRGALLTGEKPLYLVAEVADGLGWRSAVYDEPPWAAAEKVVAEELGPYLRTLDASRDP
jgi:sulfide:quinone oxidoreductase